MAHFAKLGINGQVLTVVPLEGKFMLNADGIDDEAVGQQYLESNNNWPAQLWIQTSYNTRSNTHSEGGTPFRGNFATVGFTWDEENQIFWPPKPYASWIKDITTASWKSPVGDPPTLTEEQILQNQADTHYWRNEWDEENQTWNTINMRS
jgi:hypothetical protein